MTTRRIIALVIIATGIVVACTLSPWVGVPIVFAGFLLGGLE
jgi:hypothetical protein